MSKIVIISFWAGEVQASGSNRINSFIKYLDALGWNVVVLYPDFTSKNLICTKKYFFETDALVDGVKYYRLPGWSLFAWLQNKIIRKHQGVDDKVGTVNKPNSRGSVFHFSVRCIKKIILKLGYHLIKGLAFPDDVYWGWFRPNRKKVLNIIAVENPDIVLTSALPIACHSFGSLMKKRNNIPWVADFRDYYAYGVSPAKLPGVERLKLAWMRHVVKEATALITVSKGLAKGLKSQLNQDVHVIYNGYDAAEIDKAMLCHDPSFLKEKETIYGCYCGRLYPAQYRAFHMFLKWVNDHFDFFVQHDYRFVIMGPTSQEIQKMVLDFGGHKLVNLFKFLGKKLVEHAFKCQAESCALLHFDYDQDGNLSGKVFEYFYFQKPIVVFSRNDESELCQLLREQGHFVVMKEGGSDPVMKYIKNFSADFGKRASAHYFSRSSQADKLSVILQRTLGTKV